MLRRPLVVMLAGWLYSLALLAVIASTAQASCGDWVAHLGDRKLASETSARSRAGGEPTRGIAERGALDSRPLPCHGPHCRQSPERPLPLAPTTVPVRGDQLGLVVAADEASPRAGQFDTHPPSRIHPAKGFFPCLDHPPRIS